MDSNEAFERVKTALARAPFAHKRRIGGLTLESARRIAVGVVEVATTITTRTSVAVEAPLVCPPVAPSTPFELWGRDWPPRSAEAAGTRYIDVTSTYEVLPCPRCRAAGRLPCGACLGSGIVNDAQRRGGTLPCGGCRGAGTLMCHSCSGHCQLVRFPRIMQEGVTQRRSVCLHEEQLSVPRGVPTGTVQLDVPPIRHLDEARRLLKEAAPALPPDCLGRLAHEVLPNGREGEGATWLSVRGDWQLTATQGRAFCAPAHRATAQNISVPYGSRACESPFAFARKCRDVAYAEVVPRSALSPSLTALARPRNIRASASSAPCKRYRRTFA
jgi:hypothetical protein